MDNENEIIICITRAANGWVVRGGNILSRKRTRTHVFSNTKEMGEWIAENLDTIKIYNDEDVYKDKDQV